MPEHIQYEDDDLFNPETHHEHSDVPVRPLIWSLIIFVVFGIVAHIVLGFLFKGLVSSERKRAEAPQTTVARPADADVPKGQPLLQPFPMRKTLPQNSTPVVDLIEMRKREDAVLRNYGWVDRQKGVVHIPIDEAKGRVVAQLSVAAATAPAPATATTTAPATTAPASTAAPANDSGADPPPSQTTTTTTTGSAHP